MLFDANGWLDEAIEIDYLNKSMSRQGYKINYVVCHGTAGGSSAENIGTYFRDSDVQASTHFVIGRDGHIVQGVPLSLAAWGNGDLEAGHASYLPENLNPNLYTVSIEHVKPSTDNSDALTPIQAQKSFELIKCICGTYGVPKHAGDGSGGIISHKDIAPQSRARCPGPYPWSDLWNYLAGHPAEDKPMEITLATPGVSQFFEGDPAIWKCKQNGLLVGHGILDFYRKFGNNALCGLTHLGLPLTGETYVEGKPGFVYQRFERAVLFYDVNHKEDSPPGAGPVYLAHIDSGIGQDPRVVSLQNSLKASAAENADLRKKLEAAQAGIPQAVLDDIQILKGNVDKLAKDAGVA